MSKIIRDSSPPIFIVGPPRSGTSLLSAIMGSHSRIACGPETDLFKCVPQEDASRIISGPKWVEQVTERLECILYPDGRSLISHFGLTKESVRDYLSTQEPSPKAVYSAVPAAFAKAQGKARWAEKTPRHILYVETIRKLYPEAKIIRIVRDPRDSIPSVIKNIGLSTSLIGEFYRWMTVFTISHSFFENDLNSITVRYEDLVQDPSQKVREICKFLGENFESSMLDRSGAEHVRVASETWKNDIDKKINDDNVFGWKLNMDNKIARAASLICCDALEILGYPNPEKPKQEINVFPLGENFGVANEPHIIDCAQKGFRYTASPIRYPANIAEALKPHPDVLLGDLPLGKNTTLRFSLCFQAIWIIVRRYFLNKPVTVDPSIRLGVGTLSQVVGKIALIFGSRRTFTE
nr:sulfotransferase [uncultured Microbulbifer sp.]